MAEQIEEDEKILINNNNTNIKNLATTTLINIQCRLWIDNTNYVDLNAISDTESTKSLIGYSLLDPKFHKSLNYKMETRTVENRIMKITHCLEPIGTQFLNFAGNYSLKYDLSQGIINPKETNSKDIY